ncbi:monoacylglycerol lipase [Deinococcus xinjiangensis]|uniref:Monoacylglycerol lipase n=1 Tax=Deinococcus xinjiangensis TaxID=457454 RepID=A0ABP9V4S2_9DEIO
MTNYSTWNIPNAPVTGHAWEIAEPHSAILITHALAEYAQRYYDKYNGLISALNKAGYNVYSYDLRGHGDSAGDISLVDSFVQVADHLAVRQAVKQRQPHLPLYLFAHSAGALFTAGSVLENQNDIAGIILSSPMLQAGQDQVALVRHLLPLVSKLAPSLAIVPINSSGLSRLQDEIAAYNNDPRIYHGKVTLLTASTMLSLSQKLWPQHAAWQIPTLVFYGTQDQVSYMEGLPQFIETIASKDKTLHTFEGGYHELLNDQDRDQVLSLILDWLKTRQTNHDQKEQLDQINKSRLERLERLRSQSLRRAI